MSSYYEKVLATGEVKCIDEEVPFEIPQGWEWCRMRDVIQLLSGRDLEPSMYNSSQKGIPYITGASNFNNENLIVNRWTQTPVTVSEEGDLLITCKGTIGTMAFNNIGSIHIARQIMAIHSKDVDLHYLKLYFELNIGTLESQANSMIPGISREVVLNSLVPIPPLQEQIKIVEKSNSLMPLVSKYSFAQGKLNLLNNVIKNKLEKTILQEAIKGKLVPQIAEEGTAQELLEQIKAEKQKLVKEGKLKKSTLNDSVIFRGDDNKYYEQIGKKCLDITEQIPFYLPESWSWARGMSVFMPMESTKPSSDFVYIDVDAVNNRLNIIDNPKKVRFENAPSRATRKLHKNDLLFSMVRPYLKNIALVDDIYIDAIASTGFYVITPSLGYYPMFLFYLMLSNYVVDGLNAFMKGDNSPSINNCHIEDYLYPLPPIEEQKRIVNKIEQLFKQLR